MKKITFSILLIAFLIGGCSPYRSINNQKENNEKTKTSIIADWKLEMMSNKKYNQEQTSKNIRIRFDANNNRFSGNDGCNQIFGNYQLLDDNNIIIEKIASTKMACMRMELSGAYKQLLRSSKHYTLEGETLKLFDASGQTVLKYVKIEKPNE